VKALGEVVLNTGGTRDAFWLLASRDHQWLHMYGTRTKTGTRKSNWSIPFPPDWLPVVLGLVSRDPAKATRVVPHPDGLELTEQAVSESGTRLRRLTVLRWQAGSPQILSCRLENSEGEVICLASVIKSKRDRETGLTFPQQLRLSSPSLKWAITLNFGNFTVNRPLGDRMKRLFRPPDQPSPD
jgi:hypothetical protein